MKNSQTSGQSGGHTYRVKRGRAFDKTQLSFKTNRIIGGIAPSKCVRKLKETNPRRSSAAINSTDL